MGKRGRPTAAATHLSESFSQSLKLYEPDKTTRTHAAMYYRTAAGSLLSEAASDIPYLDGIYRREPMAIHMKSEILEQLGRLYIQDGQNPEDVLHIATLAAQYYHDGYTVKEIKAWILQVRKDWKT